MTRNQKISVRRIPIHLFVGIWAVTELFLLIWMFYSSFKTTDQIYRDIWGLPTTLTTTNYQQDLVGAPPALVPFGNFLFSSALISFMTVGVVILLALPAGYVLSKPSRASSTLFYLFLAMIAVPPPAVLIPVFYLLKGFGLYDTYLGIILVYVAFNLPFSTVLSRAFFKTFPKDLEEAARIDGLSDIGVFARIVFPLSSVIVVILAIINFPNVWNELLYALVILPTDDVRTIQPGLILLNSQFRIQWGNIFAGLVMSSLPMIVFYIIFQKYVVRAVVVGAIKG